MLQMSSENMRRSWFSSKRKFRSFTVAELKHKSVKSLKKQIDLDH